MPRALSATLVASAAVAAAASAGAAAAATATLTIDVDHPLPAVEAGWPGVNIDTASLHNGIDLTDGYLRTLTKQLVDAGGVGGGGAPLLLRIGGTASNAMVYVPGDAPGHGDTVTDATLRGVDAFATAAGARVLFGLPYQRGRDGTWDPNENATALWASVASLGLQSFWGWSLGNELIGGAGVNSSVYGADYARFRAYVTAHAPGWAQAVFGPSAPGYPGAPVLSPFVDAAVAGGLTQDGGGWSFHAYAFKNCSLAVYTNKAAIEHIDYYLTSYSSLRDAIAPGVPLYLEEFATQAGGGCDGLSNRFVAGFFYVHALNLAGQRGIARVTRQDLIGWSFSSGVSHYPLAGPPGWVNASRDGLPTPHPDYFTTLLWRQLVGATPLPSTLAAGPSVNASLGLHAWCANDANAAALGYPAGSVAVAYINVGADDVALGLGGGLPASPRLEWLLTPPGGDLTADGVLLNGAPLGVDGGGAITLPVAGRAVQPGGPAPVLPAGSYGFLLLPGAGASAGCSGKAQ